MLEFKKDFNDNWKIVDESGLISINVRPDKVKVFHTRMEEFDEFIDVLDYVETLTGEVVNPNIVMSQSEAIKKLKASKDLMELEIISKEEHQ